MAATVFRNIYLNEKFYLVHGFGGGAGRRDRILINKPADFSVVANKY